MERKTFTLIETDHAYAIFGTVREGPCIANWSSKVGEDAVAKFMAKAFGEWSKYSKLRFVRVYDPSADIIVGFGSGHHGDNYPFDGPGNVLAHAFYPYEMNAYGGDVHFDEDENWKENSTHLSEGVDFYSVAIHELGHSLGLAHSPVYSSLMFPYYKGIEQGTLDYDDILAMYQLYIQNPHITDDPDWMYTTESATTVDEFFTVTPAPRLPDLDSEPHPGLQEPVYTSTTTTPSTTEVYDIPITFVGDYETVDDHISRHHSQSPVGVTTPHMPADYVPVPDICSGSFDAIGLLRGEIFIFKGAYLWRLTAKYRIKEGYPVRIWQVFRGFPKTVTHIDAVYERLDDNAIVLFSGRVYWVFDALNFLHPEVRPLTDYGLPEDLKRIDAALVWPKNNKTYLFAGDHFWRYNDTAAEMDEGYPSSMDRWFGIPKNIDAATAVASDFEVHRNWLAITHSLPLSRWYYEKTSEWTLDYPPFFAYFEWLLSLVAKSFDPRMLDVKNLNYASEQTIVFQRFSVIVTDVIYALGVRRCLRALTTGTPNTASRSILIGGALLLGNAGLLMVDHIHFQYNGFLFGVLLLSIGALMENRPLQAALLFAALLNLKHIFMYVAPVYMVYLLRFYCLRDFTIGQAVGRLIKLGTIVLGICLLSFGPFYEHIPQVLSRLFPFTRGLTHAYWAPNFWALYNTADKALAVALGKVAKGSSTGGLVQTFEHTVLPSITPAVTFALTGVFMVPILLKLWTLKSTASHVALGRSFVRAIVLCGCTSFLFGWHVHEKAILMVLIPLTLLAIGNQNDARWTIFLGVVAHYSLFPLLFKPELTVVKISLHAVYTGLSVVLLKLLHRGQFFRTVEFLYLAGFPVLCAYENVVHDAIGLGERLPFLPLLLTSVYCAVGVLYFWVSYQLAFLRTNGGETSVTEKKKTK
uniref:dolichyl-P-Glc:Glc1Man9GlcNAc2-PP-dolichol alpha-1,3-glucosyltransferase n=1 Tax=Anopheles stephensi TaxID=30069 RepID=A0A182XXK7_ANOST